MNDSMEQTLKKVINDIDLQGDDEMAWMGTRRFPQTIRQPS